MMNVGYGLYQELLERDQRSLLILKKKKATGMQLHFCGGDAVPVQLRGLRRDHLHGS
jgi:hypothetical protein